MLPIVGCSLVAVAVFIERWRAFSRANVDANQLISRVMRLVREERSGEALDICRASPGPVARILEVGILHKDESVSNDRIAMGDAAKLEVDRLEKGLPLLVTIGQIAPLLGLLGTVSGMIEVFQEIEALSGHVAVADISAGIWQALLTTAGGLVVATLSVIAHHYLTRKVEMFVQDSESAAVSVLELVRARQKGGDDTSDVGYR
jgi:biopolymer transport protein ExbB